MISSYGALMYEVYTDGKTPFETCGLRGNELRKAIIGKRISLAVEVELPVFIANIFEQSRQYETEDRISSKQIIQIFKEVCEAFYRFFVQKISNFPGSRIP